ncbi:aminoglycoside phosphotransferase family protein [Streptomyces sp. SBT349]|uniref:aminoglycoside phosphotransferase family protein n=1 Tax=Streptomyces sp. SBT349 TaxID=1580539 RepID=UPI00066BB44F|nr:aminoglycoside phosphotransferase family protein [Streptomyces sp. SBT349]
MNEEPLSGGNASAGVVRVGDTVRRPAGPWTPAVHALLDHLHRAGYAAAPRPLGIDERGREVLTFAPGRTVWPERFPLLDPEARLARVARLIRAFHDAVADFTPPPGARWQNLMPSGGAEIVIHHDLAPWNLVVDDATDTWTFIDWDVAGPGTRLWDLAYAAHGFVPLSAAPGLGRPDRAAAARLRLFADAYGLTDEADRRALVPLLARRCLSMHDFLRAQAAQGVQPWATLWNEGHGTVWKADAAYAEARSALWTSALLG